VVTSQVSLGSRGISWLQTSLSLGAVTAVAIYVTSPTLRAPFGSMDDHEPLRWMGRDRELALSEVLPLLLQDTEVGQFGETSRFRPSYYLVRVLQTVFLGPNPLAWYLSVLCAYITACALLSWSVSRWALAAAQTLTTSRTLQVASTSVATVISAVLFVSIHAWSDIAIRLGPAEMLALLGISVAVLSATMLVERQSSKWFIPLLLGVVTAVGAKEVMLPWGLLPATLAYLRYSFGDSKALVSATSLIGFLGSAVVAAAVIPPIVVGGEATYGARDGSRLALTLQGLLGVFPAYWAPSALALFCALVFFSFVWWKRDQAFVLTLWLLAVLSLAWFFFDALIYFGAYEAIRYNINWQFLKVLWIIAAVLLSCIALGYASSLTKRIAGILTLTLSSLLLALAITDVPNRVIAIRSAAHDNFRYTTKYQEQLDRYLTTIQENPQATAVIVWSDINNYEGVVAVAQAIRLASGADRAIVVTFDPRSEDYTGMVQRYAAENFAGTLETVLPESSGAGAKACAYIRSDPGDVPICGSWPAVRIDA